MKIRTVALGNSPHLRQRLPTSIQSEDILASLGVIQIYEWVVQAHRLRLRVQIGNAFGCEFVDQLIIGGVLPFGVNEVGWCIVSIRVTVFGKKKVIF